jgi:phosphoribosyl 1,2-cyclic phosphate phosphodiesterase
MRLKFLGTAAAEGFPGIFCKCATCEEARRLGGKDLRYRSALLVNTDLLIDFGPDLMAAAQRFGLSLWTVTTALITHAHSDHFYLSNFEMRKQAFTAGLEIPTLTVYGSPDVKNALAGEFSNLDEARLAVQTVMPFQSWQAGGYQFRSFRAYHAVGSLDCRFYAVERPEGSFLYATDTGLFPAETWSALTGRRFDVIILEETLGTGNYTQHLGFETFLQTAAQMRSANLLKPGGRLIAHHFSHSANPTHARLVEFFTAHGVEVAYDGLEITI